MSKAEDFIRLAMALPGVTQHPHFDRVAFKARVTFATLAPDRLSANFKFAPDEQALKCEVASDAFSPIPNKWGAQGWTVGRFDALSEAELDAALRMAFAHAGPKPGRRSGRG